MRAAIFVLILLPTLTFGATAQKPIKIANAPPASAVKASGGVITAPAPIKPAEKKLSAVILIETSSTIQEGAEGSAGEGLSQSGIYQADVSYKLPLWDLSLTGRAGWVQEYTYIKRDDGHSGEFRDSRLSLGKAWKDIFKNANVGATLRWNIPTSRDSQLAQFKSGLAAEGHIDYTWKKFTLEFTPRYTQNFHTVEVQDNGVLNNQYSILTMYDLTYAFTDKLSASVHYWPVWSFTYQGTFRERYTFSYEVGYQFTPMFAAGLGLSNLQLTTKDNGQDSNFSLYDPYQMTAYLDLTLLL